MRTDAVVAISGAAGGLGPTAARAFFEAGARLAVCGRRKESLMELLDSIGVPEDRRLATAADLSDPEAARGWARAVRERFGGVDVVLHLVGGYKGGTSISEIPPADWDFLRAAVVETTLNVVRAFAADLKAGGRGRFISVTSPKVQSPTAKAAVYAMAKAASDAVVMALADELRGSGATANLISVNSIGEPADRAGYGKSTPPAEIAASMLYLCSDAAASMNGARLSLTGRG
jgi:NAD(P)-dependent dehydrogenase (short-subunit alcohol dehydrogenase family)